MKPDNKRRRGEAMRDDHARILARLALGGMHPDRILCKAEAAALSNLHVRTFDRVLEAGKGPPRVTLSPGRIGFRLGDVQEWHAACREVGPRKGDDHQGSGKLP